MAALTAPRDTKGLGDFVDPRLLNYTVAGTKKIYPGAMVVLNASGYLEPGTAALGKTAVGVCVEPNTVDNTSGSDGALTCQVQAGPFKMLSGASADLVGVAQLGQFVYIIDDQTVGTTDGNGTRSIAGKVVALDSDGLPIVEFNVMDAGQVIVQPQSIVSIQLNLASLANGNGYSFTPGFAGRILAANFIVTVPATTASKLATLQPRIGGTLITGGIVALTSANCTPAGAGVAGSAVTALNTFTAAQAIDINQSAVTAFVEGSGTLQITLR